MTLRNAKLILFTVTVVTTIPWGIRPAYAQDNGTPPVQLHQGYTQIAWADFAKPLKDSSLLPINGVLYSNITPSNNKHMIHKNLIRNWRNDLKKVGTKRIYWYSRGYWFAPDEFQIVTSSPTDTIEFLSDKLSKSHLKITAVGKDRVSIRPVVDRRSWTPSLGEGLNAKWRQNFLNRSHSTSTGWALFSTSQIFLPIKGQYRIVYDLTEEDELLGRLFQSNRAIACTENDGDALLRFRLKFLANEDVTVAMSLLQGIVKQHLPEQFNEMRFETDENVLTIDMLTKDSAKSVSAAVNRLRKIEQ